MANPIAVRFECTCCGKCCSMPSGHTVLSVSDIRNIADHLQIDPTNFIASHCYFLCQHVHDGSGNSLYELWDICLKKTDLGCVFLSDNLCRVHDVKPLYCKSYPFIGSREYVEFTAREGYCEGFGVGPTYGEAEIRAELAKYRASYLAENKQLIENYMDVRHVFGIFPETFSEEYALESNVFSF